MDAPTFRGNFPEFADSVKYPDTLIDLYLGIAVLSLPADRWGSWLDYGLQLFVAHHIAIGAMEEQAAAVGGIPGQIKAPKSASAVDKVSKSMDTGAVTEQGAGFWNLTTYGIRFYRLAMQVGAGGVQVMM